MMSYLFTLLISSCIEIRNDVDSFFEEKGDNSNLNFTIIIMIIVFCLNIFMAINHQAQ